MSMNAGIISDDQYDNYLKSHIFSVIDVNMLNYLIILKIFYFTFPLHKSKYPYKNNFD